MTLSFVELLFLVSLFLPPAVVLIGAVSLLRPARRHDQTVRSARAHAH